MENTAGVPDSHSLGFIHSFFNWPPSFILPPSHLSHYCIKPSGGRVFREWLFFQTRFARLFSIIYFEIV